MLPLVDPVAWWGAVTGTAALGVAGLQWRTTRAAKPPVAWVVQGPASQFQVQHVGTAIAREVRIAVEGLVGRPPEPYGPADVYPGSVIPFTAIVAWG